MAVREENIKFKRGKSDVLPEEKEAGTLLVETDTGNAYIDDTDSSRIQIKDDTKLLLTGGTMEGDIDMGSNNITTSHVPSNGEDVVNKDYLDSKVITYEGEEPIEVSGNTISHKEYGENSGGPSSDITPNFGESFTVPSIESDSYGHVTSVIDRNVTLPEESSREAIDMLLTGVITAFLTDEYGNVILESDDSGIIVDWPVCSCPDTITDDEIDALFLSVFAIYSADDNSLTFYNDAPEPLEGDSYNGKIVTNVYTGFETETWSSESSVSWYPIIDSITKVVIDASFKNVQPVSLALWFGDMTNCATIEGLEFLNTRNVTTMYRLFRHCENITQLDVSTWDTSKVTTMEQTFSYCYKLKYLDLSNFDTSNVTAMNGMIRDASVLEELNLSGFDTNKVTMLNAFLRDSPNLKTIYADRDFAISANLTNDDNMFYNCTSLVGGNGTEYDSSKVTSDMAKIDRNGTQGYFTEK